MAPDQACYEERYRLTGGAALGLAASLLSVGLGFLWHTPVVFAVIAVILLVLTVTTPRGGVIDAVRRLTAFRADHAGITLGAAPGKLAGRGPAVFIPWGDVERIVVYPSTKRGRGDQSQVQCIGVQRREGAPPCHRATSRPPAAQCQAWQPGPAARSAAGGWTVSVSPPPPRP